MELFIRIKDGQPFEHPILGENFRTAFPKVNTDDLPSEFARFERVDRPELGVYQVYVGVNYEWVDGVVKDVHQIRDMTQEEKTAKQDGYKAFWNERWGYASWTFDEENCVFVPPVPPPSDGNVYDWDEDATSWVLVE